MFFIRNVLLMSWVIYFFYFICFFYVFCANCYGPLIMTTFVKSWFLWLWFDGQNKQVRLLCRQFVWNTVPLSCYRLKYLYWTNPCFYCTFLFSVSPVVFFFLAALTLAHVCSDRSSAVNMYIIISYLSSDLHHMSTVFLFFKGKRQDVTVLVPLVHFF